MTRTGPVAVVATAVGTALTLVVGALVNVCAPATADAAPSSSAAAPNVQVTRVVGGLKIPWDVTWVANTMLFNERAGKVWSKTGNAAPTRVNMQSLPPIFAESEAGMLGMVADPHASTNGYFYTCMAAAKASGSAKDVEVWKWLLKNPTTAVKVKVMIKGIPLDEGRHSGCRLRFRSSHMLYVGTGDAAQGKNPQNLKSLGGKILRIRDDGSIPKTNPFYQRGGNARYVWNFGHRNVQGLIKRPGKSELWSVEHGPTRDDEVNLVWKDHNYGWDPTPGYDESRPMTDKKRHPGANGAKWRSGPTTVATSGGTFISGTQWGSWNGVLAVAMLKGQGIKLFTVNKANKISGEQTVFRGYGRIRTVEQGPGGALYFTTSNGSNDSIYKITVR